MISSSRTPQSSDAIYYLGSTAFQVLAGVVVLPIAARVLGAERFGVVVLLLSSVKVAATLGPLGAPQRLVGVFADGGMPGRVVRNVVRAASRASLIVGAVLSALLWLVEYTEVSLAVAITTGLAAALVGTARVLQTATRLVGEARETALGMTVVGPGALLGGTLLAWWIDAEVDAYVFGYLLIVVIGVSYSMWRLRMTVGMAESVDSSQFDHVSLLTWAAVPLVLHSVMMALLNVADRFIIAETLGEVAVGEYHLAYQAFIVLSAGTVALANSWSPDLVRAYSSAGRANISSVRARGARWAVLLASLLVALWGADALVFFHVLDAPLAQPILVAVLAAAGLPFHDYLVRSYMCLSERQYWLVATSSLAAAATGLAAGVALARPLGLLGIACATLLSYLVLWLSLALRGSDSVPLTEISHAGLSIAGVVVAGWLALREGGRYVETIGSVSALVAFSLQVRRRGFADLSKVVIE